MGDLTVLTVVYLVLTSFAVFGEEQNNKSSVDSCTDPKKLEQRFGGDPLFKKALDSARVLGRPLNSELLPGDILVYPRDVRPLKGGYPDLYQVGMQSFGHAAIVADSEEGNRYSFSTRAGTRGQIEPLDGKDMYFVVRPKVPEGKTRGELGKEISLVANTLRRAGFDYDVFWTMDYLNPESLSKMKRALETGDRKQIRSAFPPQSCAELTQTTCALADVPLARLKSAAEILDLAIITAKTLDEKDRIPAIDATLANIMERYFYGLPEKKQRLIQSRKKSLSKEEQKQIDTEIADVDRVLLPIQLGMNQVRALALQKLREDTGTKSSTSIRLDQLLNGALEKVLQRKFITRPADILSEAFRSDGRYEMVGVWPGEMSACFSRSPIASTRSVTIDPKGH